MHQKSYQITSYNFFIPVVLKFTDVQLLEVNRKKHLSFAANLPFARESKRHGSYHTHVVNTRGQSDPEGQNSRFQEILTSKIA